MVGRKVQPENVTGVVINVSGLAGRVFAVAMEKKRAPLLPSIPAPPTVSLSMDLETFACLACRRREPQAGSFPSEPATQPFFMFRRKATSELPRRESRGRQQFPPQGLTICIPGQVVKHP